MSLKGFLKEMGEFLNPNPMLPVIQFSNWLREIEERPRRIDQALTAEYGPVMSRWPRGIMEPADLSARLDAEYRPIA